MMEVRGDKWEFNAVKDGIFIRISRHTLTVMMMRGWLSAGLSLDFFLVDFNHVFELHDCEDHENTVTNELIEAKFFHHILVEW